LNLGKARLQKSGEQLELPFEGVGETREANGSGEVFRATRGDERSGTGCLMERVVERANLKAALKRVKQNKGGPGIDAMTVGELPDYLKREWERIRGELLSGTYQPQPVKRKTIPKAGGGERELGIKLPYALPRPTKKRTGMRRAMHAERKPLVMEIPARTRTRSTRWSGTSRRTSAPRWTVTSPDLAFR